MDAGGRHMHDFFVRNVQEKQSEKTGLTKAPEPFLKPPKKRQSSKRANN
jgi:hypothetical protein